jgi:hypothetical protein
VFCQRLGDGRIAKIYSFESRMLMNKVAVANPEHLPALKALCEEAGIELPKTPDRICKLNCTPSKIKFACTKLLKFNQQVSVCQSLHLEKLVQAVE